MSKIKIVPSGKGGPACSWSVDVNFGCNVGCLNCYGFSTSRVGKVKYQCVKEKEYDSKEFAKSINYARTKGMDVYRLGKHSDSCPNLNDRKANRILEQSEAKGIRAITVSKSIERKRVLIKHFKPGGHVLHISAGMLTSISNEERIKTFNWYKRNGANVRLRITDDITSELPSFYNSFCDSEVIVTPVRFKSRKEAEVYNVDINNYKYVNGFWRPTVIHESWNRFSNYCGEIGNETKCCNCLLDEANNE